MLEFQTSLPVEGFPWRLRGGRSLVRVVSPKFRRDTQNVTQNKKNNGPEKGRNPHLWLKHPATGSGRKNLWRRKCVRRTIFRNVEVRVERGEGDFAPFNHYFVCNTSNCVTVRPVRGHLTSKINIAFFIRNLMPNIFLFDNFFEKSCIFRENRKKLFWGRI